MHLVAEPVDDGSSGFENVQAYLACGVDELWAYRRYFTEESPFATHHGVKGAQFERVLVVIDDEEAGFRQYSYGKYLGYVPSRTGTKPIWRQVKSPYLIEPVASSMCAAREQ